MNWRDEFKPFIWITGLFLGAYFLPLENLRFRNAIFEALDLVNWYAREHVLLCLIPAFFIAGIISVFVSQAAVVKYFGGDARKWMAYLIASVSGGILAVCSCTVLPLFSGIHKRGAGLGPAITFLYSGPAVNILAIILTARILGLELGIARVIGAVVFSVVIGLTMHAIYRKEESQRTAAQINLPAEETRPLWQTALHFMVPVAILIFATWAKPDTASGFFYGVYAIKWWLVGIFSLLLAAVLIGVLGIPFSKVALATLPVLGVLFILPDSTMAAFAIGLLSLGTLLYFSPGEGQEWLEASWGFAKQIMPLLGAGVLAAGFLLGGPAGGNGIIPEAWVAGLVGGNSLFANFFAAVVGAFMYFATLTEIPILQGLLAGGMGKGPALALLLAGPALSLPNMLVIRQVIGTPKTAVYVTLVVIMATISGILYGRFF
ncbi:MAG: permease [Calditrichaeota bacterium]|nr:permease [Calditrichota bacterium]